MTRFLPMLRRRSFLIPAASLWATMSWPAAAASPVPSGMCTMQIANLQTLMAQGTTNPSAVASWTLNAQERIDRTGRALASTPFPNPRLLEDANAIEARWTGHPLPPLYGVTISIKDMFDVAGLPTSVGEEHLGRDVVARDSVIVARLRTAGAMIAGKGSVNANRTPWLSGYHWGGLTINPHGEGLDPQGSSTGTAVAVASGQVIAGIGEETTDSLRGVADALGLVAVRPTFGRLPTDGMYPFGVDRDVPGVLARTVADAALVLDVAAGCHERGQPCGAQRPARMKALRLGTPRTYIGAGDLPSGAKPLPFHPDVIVAFRTAVAVLESQGVEVVEVDGPGLTPTDERLSLDSSHYRKLGFPELDAQGFLDLYAPDTAIAVDRYLKQRSGGRESVRSVLKRLRADARPDQAYLRQEFEMMLKQMARHGSQRHRNTVARYRVALDELYRSRIRSTMADHRLDGFVFPTAFRPVMSVVGALRDPLEYEGENVLAHAAADFGLPAVAVPMGRTAADIPMTVTFMGDRDQDDRVISIAAAYEAASRLYRPPEGVCTD